MYWHHIITQPLIWLPFVAAIRLGRPDSRWSNWFYRNRPHKYTRAVTRYEQEYTELRRRVENMNKKEYEENLREMMRLTGMSEAELRADTKRIMKETKKEIRKLRRKTNLIAKISHFSRGCGGQVVTD
jgi:predicted RNase H-like nuclease (RuvC/YqgF family)